MLDLDFSKLSLSENPNETDTTEKDEFFNHPFLKHDLTIQFIKKSKVMYIMRGLPGSGYYSEYYYTLDIIFFLKFIFHR